MTSSTGSIYEIRWAELCPWLILVKAWRVSLLVRVVAFAWLGLLLTQVGWSVCEGLAGASATRLERLAPSAEPLADVRALPARERGLAASQPFQSYQPIAGITVQLAETGDWLPNTWQALRGGPLVRGWSWLGSPIVQVFQLRTTSLQVFQLLACGLWAIAVWGFFGGAIARIAARYLTREEIIGPVVAGRAALTKWPSTVGGPLIGLAFAGFVAIPLSLVGQFMRWNLLAMVAGFLWVLLLALGVFLAVVLVALWFGWPLMWATIAVERSDAFDAVARTASYIYQRPLRLVFYLAVATVLGFIGQLIVSGFAIVGNHLTDWAVSWGSGTDRIIQLAGGPLQEQVAPTLEGSAAVAARSIQFWKNMLMAVAAAYPLAYLFSTGVGIYLLLRLHIDSTELGEVVADSEEEAGRMPELKEDTHGLPSMANDGSRDLSTRRNIDPGEVAT